jgi:hypothetical protein
MEAEYFGFREIWQWVDEIDVTIVFHVLWCIINTRGREFVIIVKTNFFTVELFDDTFHEDSVSRICNLTAVVAFTREIPQSIEWYLVRILIYEDLELHGADPQIGFGELVLNAPPKRTVLYSLLNVGMVKAKTKEHLSENLW